MPLNLTSQNVTSNVTLVYGGQGSAGSQVQFINQSTTVTIWLGYQPTILAGQGPSIPLLPGASVAMDGAISIYGVTQTGSAVLSVVPGGIAYSSPGAFITSLFNLASTTIINANSTVTPFSMIDVSQFNSYDLYLAVSDSGQAVPGHAHACIVTLSWYDDLTSGIPIFTETWCPWVSNLANSAIANGTGPLHGQYMSISINNPTGFAVALNKMSVFASVRNVQLSDWRQMLGTNVSDTFLHIIPNPSLGTDNMLADTNGLITLAANTNYVMFFDLYSGPAAWALQYGSGIAVTRANVCNIGSNAATQTSNNMTTQANSLLALPNTAGLQTNGSLFLPRSGCVAFWVIGATGGQMEFTVTAQQGP